MLKTNRVFSNHLLRVRGSQPKTESCFRLEAALRFSFGMEKLQKHGQATAAVQSCGAKSCSMTRTRIEPMSSPWKGDVLAAWLTGLVAEVGFEPTTCRVWTGRSSQLSYSAIAKIEDSLKPCWNIISRQRAKVKMFCKDFRIFGDFSFFGEETDEILQLRE